MVDVIYVEREIADHPRVASICSRFPRASRVVCERYGEVFNPRGQNFRLQKRRPGLILARKRSGHVLAAPAGYGLGGVHNFYFSHMLNCVYDCRYCFLQGMYRSAHYVVFVNYEDFASAIVNTINNTAMSSKNDYAWFFSGYDGDSLAYEPVTRFVDFVLPLFAGHQNSWLELRTKSTQIRTLVERAPMENVVVAFSFTPPAVSRSLEHKVPSLEKRIEAAAQLQAKGWKIGLRFDPLIYYDDYKGGYRDLLAQVFASVDAQACHSATFGPFRLPQDYYRTLVKLYPDEPLFAGPLNRNERMVSYYPGLEKGMLAYCEDLLARYISPQQMFAHAVA